ncbi:MAG: hemerythrin domain-containing protein [Gemmatimonadota bacterium]|nr:MAG: hemerythrin domain-containing protein [Gemmatimonadota bacterium]
MKPLDILRDEHGLMRQFLENLTLAEKKLESNEQLPREFFEKVIEFASTFANKYHHVKEEHMMFVRLAQKQAGKWDGQIEALRHQHETGRNYMSAIKSALDGYESGNAVKRSVVLENLAAFNAMEKDHIHTEDHVFFPMVEQVFTAEEEEQIGLEFEKIRQKVGESTFEDCHKLVVEMGSILTHL